MYYVVRDEEGAWITEDKPGPGDEVILKTDDLLEAEETLCRQVAAEGGAEDLDRKRKRAIRMIAAERLLVLAGRCLNQIPSHPVQIPRAGEIRTSYDVAARIDDYLRKRFGRSAHEL